MILLRNLRLDLDEAPERLKLRAAKKLGVDQASIKSLRIVKRSLDARKKNDLHYVYSLALELKSGEERLLTSCRDASVYTPPVYEIPRVKLECRPVIVGFGPAGMFAALYLARAGARPIVIERGQEVLKRKQSVDEFRHGGRLNTESNVQFGEGGAGTFSDGKLNTGTHDRRISFVLSEFAAHGADESVTYDAKPHIGTDVLIDVVQNIRREILSLGAEIRFETKLSAIKQDKGRLCGAYIEHEGKTELIPCRSLILAIGHSARDSFEMLLESGAKMERKSFSIGVRIEHRQRDIDLAQYGRERGTLPPADYSLSVHLPNGESAYSFCMCPGGEVFAAASEEGGVVTNGMSYSARDGENANSALLVSLRAESFPEGSVLSGMYLQREIEQRAYKISNSYKAPAQLVGDFLRREKSTAAKSVTPTYTPGLVWCSLDDVLPASICQTLREAIPALGRKLRGFDDPDAVLTAPETRSSSPVRIKRDTSLQSNIRGLYPCGEGAGYAGGISSAAVDGLRCAEALLNGESG